MIVEPWPSTYESLGDRTPAKLISRFPGRAVGAFRCAIPAETIEPPQVHLIARRDRKPFEELITGFREPFQVDYWDFQRNGKVTKIYEPGQDIIIPKYVVHWLVNPNKRKLEFTCECAPHPWRGEEDEPEFRNRVELVKFAYSRGIYDELREVDLGKVLG
jgi:hypothetical protein